MTDYQRDKFLKFYSRYTSKPLIIVDNIKARRPGDRGWIPGRGKRIFPLASVSRPALGPTQPPVQWAQEVPSPGKKRGRGVTLTTHPL
jgi:hypothetical protein